MSDITRHTPFRDWPELLTLEEYAKVTDLSISAAYEHCQSHKVPAIKCGRFWRIPKAAIVAMVTEAQASCA